MVRRIPAFPARSTLPAMNHTAVITLVWCSLLAPAQPASLCSEYAQAITRHEADRGALLRKYPDSPARRERMARFYDQALAALESDPYEGLSPAGKVDRTLFKAHVSHARRRLEIDGARADAAAVFTPFQPVIFAFAEDRVAMRDPRPAQAAASLNDLSKRIAESQKAFEAGLKPAKEGEPPAVTPSFSRDVLARINSLRDTLTDWYDFSAGYDPLFTWWCEQPYKAVTDAFAAYATAVREKGVGITRGNENIIVGVPIGREALLAELDAEMIPYTPEELIAIGERELAWCEAEYAKAAADLGLGNDWRAALERAKQDHVQPGEQPALIRELSDRAVAFLRDKDLITVPDLADEVWRMEMMSPQRQLVTPFFTGGEVISVSFPTGGMAHEDKLMSLRGNNRHFSNATVFHELIPGHHLQQYACARSNTHRRPFNTAFWTEGWALYWEMTMWDRGFHADPLSRVGALFWRSHRCARIICSLKFHLGQMTAPEWIAFLTERIGHEQANAEGEVRRSVAGNYGPLYQVAYMIGGLQFRRLYEEAVGSGRMTDRQFHDAVLVENNIPVEMVRAIILNEPPPREFRSSWKFDDGE